MNKRLQSVLQFCFFLLIGSGILYWLYRNYDKAFQEDCATKGIAAADCSLIAKIINDMQQADHFWILIVLIAFMLSNVLRALRWQMLLKPLDYRPKFYNAFLAIMLAYFANLALPRIGEFVRAATLNRYEDVPFEKGFGTIITDRIIDFLSLGVIILFALFFEFDTLWRFLKAQSESSNRFAANSLYVLGGLGILALLVMAWLYLNRHSTHPFIQKVMRMWRGLLAGMSSVRSVDRPVLFILYSIGIWALYYMMTYLCFRAFEPTAHLSPAAGLVTFVFGTFGIIFPSPGGLGSYHFSITQALQVYGIPDTDAFSFANLIFFSVQILCNVLFGILALILLPIMNRKNPPRRASD